MSKFFKLFTNNLLIKIICVFISFLIWMYISIVGTMIYNVPGGIELDIRNRSDNYVVIIDQSSIEIELVAERKIWNKISAETIKAYIDINNLKEGTYEIEVKIETLVQGVEISNYSPKKVLVRIEPKTSKKIPVNIKIEGSPATGKVSSNISINPSEVEIIGAESVLKNILEATAVIRLDGETENINKKIELIALDNNNEKINNVIFNPSEVEANIEIIKADENKTVGIKVVTTGNPEYGYWISNIVTNPLTVNIAGTNEELNKINYIETNQINLEKLSNSFEKYVELNIPKGVSILDNKNKVYVQIELQKIRVNKQVQAKIVNYNLNNNYLIGNIDPAVINVNVSGDVQELSNLNFDNLKINVDLSNIPSGGIFYIDIKDEMFEIPKSIDILSFVPSSIKFIINNK